MERMNEKDLEIVTGGSGIDISKVEHGIKHLEKAARMCTAEIPDTARIYIEGLIEYLQATGVDFFLKTVDAVLSRAHNELDAVIAAGAGVELQELVQAIKAELQLAYYELDY